MGSTSIRFSTPYHTQGQERAACEALVLPLTLSAMWNNVRLWVVNTTVFTTHNRLQTSGITHIQSLTRLSFVIKTGLVLPALW